MRRLAWCVVLSGGIAHADSLTLEGAVAIARGGHPDVLAARAQVLSAQAQKGIATAGYLPSLDLVAYGRLDESNFAPVVVGSVANAKPTFPFQGSGLYYASLGINQLLFDGGRTLGQIAAARAQIAQSQAALDDQGQVIEGAVTAAFFNVLQASGTLLVAKEYEQQTATQVTSTRKLITAGIRPELDAVAAETRHQHAMLDRIRATNGLDQNRVTLLSALGREHGDDDLVEAFVNPIAEETTPIDELLARALDKRPDLRAQAAQVKAAQLNVRVVRSDYFPTMSLGLNADMTGSTDTPVFDLYGTLTLQEHFFSGLATYRGVSQARALVEVQRARLLGLRVQIRAALASAQAAVRNGAQAAQQAASLVGQADKQLASAQKRYDAGVATLLDVFDAQSQRVQARTLEVQARYMLAMARADLVRAIGGSIVERR